MRGQGDRRRLPGITPEKLASLHEKHQAARKREPEEEDNE